MALIRNLSSSSLVFLRHQSLVAIPLVTKRNAATRSTPPTVSSGRVKLDVQESGNFESSKIRELPMSFYLNKNPRSGELLGVAEKPRGFITTKRRVDYYHRLMVEMSNKHITAYVNHNNGTKVVEASTREFSISQHLYKCRDVSAAFNIGRVIAFRCKEAGLSRVMWQYTKERKNDLMVAFMKGVFSEGLILNEPKPRRRLPPPGTLPKY